MTDDRFYNFSLMADMIRVRSIAKGFVVQSNDEAIKQSLLGDFEALESNKKAWEIVRQIIFFESKGFHIRNVVSDNFIRVHGFRNVAFTTCSVQRETKLFTDNLEYKRLKTTMMLFAALPSATNTYLLGALIRLLTRVGFSRK